MLETSVHIETEVKCTGKTLSLEARVYILGSPMDEGCLLPH